MDKNVVSNQLKPVFHGDKNITMAMRLQEAQSDRYGQLVEGKCTMKIFDNETKRYVYHNLDVCDIDFMEQYLQVCSSYFVGMQINPRKFRREKTFGRPVSEQEILRHPELGSFRGMFFKSSLEISFHEKDSNGRYLRCPWNVVIKNGYVKRDGYKEAEGSYRNFSDMEINLEWRELIALFRGARRCIDTFAIVHFPDYFGQEDFSSVSKFGRNTSFSTQTYSSQPNFVGQTQSGQPMNVDQANANQPKSTSPFGKFSKVIAEKLQPKEEENGTFYFRGKITGDFQRAGKNEWQVACTSQKGANFLMKCGKYIPKDLEVAKASDSLFTTKVKMLGDQSIQLLR